MSRFAKAKAKAGTATKKKAKKKARAEVSISGLTDLAAVKDTIKALEGLAATFEDEVNEQITDYFVKTGFKAKVQPENFTGLDAESSASCQIRKRSARSALKAAEVERLEDAGISFEESDETVFYINKAYEGDEELMDRVSEALDGVEGLPEDFLLCRPTKHTTTTTSLSECFQKAGTLDELRELLEICSTVAKRTKFEGSVTEALDRIKGMIGDDE